MWLGDGTATRAGISFQLVLVLIQVALATTSGFFSTHPHNLTPCGQYVRLGTNLILVGFAALFTAAGTANDVLNSFAIAISYTLEASAIACILASVVLFDDSLLSTAKREEERLARVEAAMRLGVASLLLLQAASFPPLALRMYDSLVVPIVLEVWSQDPGTPVEVACAVLAALVHLPLQVGQSLLGISVDSSGMADLTMEVGETLAATASNEVVSEDAADQVTELVGEASIS